MKRKAPDRRAQARRAALNALKRAARAAARAGIELTKWEDEFLDSVSQRVAAYGRAFADPEKGSAGQALSVRQGVKLKQITAKAKQRRAPSRDAKLGNSSDPD